MQNKVKHNFNRFAKTYDEFAIVQQEIAKRLHARLEIIHSKQPLSQQAPLLELGGGTGLLTKHLLTTYTQQQLTITDIANNALALNPATEKICLDSHYLPFKSHSFNTVLSNLMMQWCDIKIVSSEVNRVLNNNGVFLFSTFGPQTLIELKESWQSVDTKHHISDFIDMHNIGDILLGLGFKNVVVESEIITLTYEKVLDLLRDLKNIGAQNINAQNINKNNLRNMIQNYEKFRTNNKLPASYETIYAHGTKVDSAKKNDFSSQTIQIKR